MKQTPRRRSLAYSTPAKPIQDIAVAKRQSEQFPAVGVTLSSYQGSRNTSQKSGYSEPTPTKPKRRFITKRGLKRTLIALIVLFILVGAFLGGKFLYDLHKAFGGSIFGLLSPTKLKGEDSGRVNILLAGEAGQNSGQTGGPNLTDSIMVVSIDTKNHTGWMLSIPRDLWVKIPGNGYGKINSVYEDDGINALQNMVSHDLNLPIDYHALINYDAFKQAVNAVGGITINLKSPDPRGIYDAYTHLKLANGKVTLNGQQALDLARARGDNVAGDISYGLPGSDFDRTMHQRQMLEALKAKATSSGVLANPIKLSQLFDALGSNVKTDLTVSDAKRLYDLSKQIPNNKIQSLSLNDANGQNLLTSAYYYGQDVLEPAAGANDYSDIQAFVAQHTSNNPIVQEDAKVVVLNGTSTPGLASKYQKKLESDHINVDHVGDAYSSYNASTQIIDASNGKMPATKQALVQMFGNNVTTTNPYSGYYDADFIVILGNSTAGRTT